MRSMRRVWKNVRKPHNYRFFDAHFMKGVTVRQICYKNITPFGQILQVDMTFFGVYNICTPDFCIIMTRFA